MQPWKCTYPIWVWNLICQKFKPLKMRLFKQLCLMIYRRFPAWSKGSTRTNQTSRKLPNPETFSWYSANWPNGKVSHLKDPFSSRFVFQRIAFLPRYDIEESSEFLQPMDSGRVAVDEDDYQTLEDIKTTVHPPYSQTFFGYNRVPWNLKIRKEMFSPSETISSPLAINLVFCQVCVTPIGENGPFWMYISFSLDCPRRVFTSLYSTHDWGTIPYEDLTGWVRHRSQECSRASAQAQHQEEHHWDGQGLQCLLLAPLSRLQWHLHRSKCSHGERAPIFGGVAFRCEVGQTSKEPSNGLFWGKLHFKIYVFGCFWYVHYYFCKILPNFRAIEVRECDILWIVSPTSISREVSKEKWKRKTCVNNR